MNRILLVEDDPSGELLLSGQLRDLGCELLRSPNAAQALRLVSEQAIDLAVLELRPASGLSGPELCTRLRQAARHLAPPILIVSVHVAQRSAALAAFEAGASAFLARGELALVPSYARALLRLRALQVDLALHNRSLSERVGQLEAELERAARVREAPSGPDAAAALAPHARARSNLAHEEQHARAEVLLLVDENGFVCGSDRAACELLGFDAVGRSLGELVPSSGLEAFARHAHADPHGSLRFELPARGLQPARAMRARVQPLMPSALGGEAAQCVLHLRPAAPLAFADELGAALGGELPPLERAALRDAARACFPPASLLGRSACVCAARESLRAAAAQAHPLLVRGPRGAGKRLVARILHATSAAPGLFVEIDGAARRPAPDDTAREPLELEAGLRAARCGALYLAEVGALAPHEQELLLRLLESATAATRARDASRPRLIAGTSLDLEAHCREGRFSAALLDALRSHSIELAPLCERTEDIAVLAEAFVARAAQPNASALIEADALSALEAYAWPGNVRELQAALAAALQRSRGGPLALRHLPPAVRASGARVHAAERAILRPMPRLGEARALHALDAPGESTASSAEAAQVRESAELAQRASFHPVVQAALRAAQPLSLADFERLAFEYALHLAGGNRRAAARVLGITKSTLYRRMAAESLAALKASPHANPPPQARGARPESGA
jgi:DNA-binding NtrC family response regulator